MSKYNQIPVREPLNQIACDVNQLQRNITFILDTLSKNNIKIDLYKCTNCGAYLSHDKCNYCGSEI